MEQKIYKVVNDLCCIFLLGMVIIVSIVVVGRYVFNITPGWGEEMALFCMTWFGMMSAALAEQKNAHIRVSALDQIFPEKMVWLLHKLYYFIKLLFALVLIVEGIKITITNIPVKMVGLPISEAFLYLAGPVTGVLLLIFLLLRFKKEVLN